MLKYTQMSITGVTIIDEKDVIQYMASCPDNRVDKGTYRFSKIILNRDIYDTHKEECDADASAFEKKVIEYADLIAQN